MVSLADHPFTSMFSSGPEPNFSRYPDPPHSAESYDTSANDNTSPMEMNGIYSMPTTMGFEQSLYAEAAHYTLGHSQPSPGLYPEDGDLRMPSSSLSTASANSSAIGSPQSNPARSAPVPEWNAQGMGVRPGIVGNDYISPEYAGYSGPGMEDSLAFDFAQAKGFVGEFPEGLFCCRSPKFSFPLGTRRRLTTAPTTAPTNTTSPSAPTWLLLCHTATIRLRVPPGACHQS